MSTSLTKKCCTCKKIKQANKFHKDTSRKDGYAPRCAKCDNINHKEYRKNNPEKIKVQRKKFSGKYKHKYKAYQIMYEYNMSIDEYQDMFKKQNSTCAICFTQIKPDKGLRSACIDHDHETGKVRELLCFHCNTGLGMFKDNIGLLENSVKYLKKWTT
jgi:hypothetical protein